MNPEQIAKEKFLKYLEDNSSPCKIILGLLLTFGILGLGLGGDIIASTLKVNLDIFIFFSCSLLIILVYAVGFFFRAKLKNKFLDEFPQYEKFRGKI
ncbi:MAG: hypothetical protein US15_C0041G0003 [Candidatus Moranbacteria bacterium GW2011_GWF1_36_4]|nr:MAG: hypothetical protein US15_C0041G0003 [Candidatus Moranbacteria bacterium GW2011_GWF1_36_4]HBO16585.1 hypothetical protein [Candidatus Moranbacteria bacterium]